MSTTTQRKSKLTKKQEAFLEHYIADGFNATQAARSAGYSANGARVTAHKLLTNANILQNLTERLKPMLAERAIDHARVLDELAAIAFTRSARPWPGKATLRVHTHNKLAALFKLADICNLVKQHGDQQQAQQVIVNIIADGKPIEANIIDDDASPTDREAGAQGRSFAKPRANSTLARQN